MKTIEKSNIFIFVLILLSTSIFAQIKEVETDKPIEYKKHFHEINYKPVAALGYSYIRNFNNKFLLGGEVHLGGCFYFPRYADYLYFKIFVRNVFSRNKLGRKWNYDIGYYSSLSYYDVILEGLAFQISYDIWKFSIGMNIQGGFVRDGLNYDDIKFVKAFTLNPVLTYKF